MKLLNTIFFFLLTLTISFQTYSQNNDILINEIKKKVQSIDQDSIYAKLTLENEEFMDQMTDNGGELIGFFKEDQILKIQEKIGVSNAVKTTNYYFSKGDLIFVNEKEEDFPYIDSLATLDYTKTEKVFEAYYYLKNNKLIKISTKGERRIAEDYSPASTEKMNALKNSAKRNKSILIRRKK